MLGKVLVFSIEKHEVGYMNSVYKEAYKGKQFIQSKYHKWYMK